VLQQVAGRHAAAPPAGHPVAAEDVGPVAARPPAAARGTRHLPDEEAQEPALARRQTDLAAEDQHGHGDGDDAPEERLVAILRLLLLLLDQPPERDGAAVVQLIRPLPRLLQPLL
jgi:hypothetical protein